MTGLTSHAGPARGFALKRVAGAALRQARNLLRALVHRREVMSLVDLDDRTLKDIGLVRSDVLRALAEPYHKDPSTVLLVRCVDRRARSRPVVRAVPLVPARPQPAEQAPG